MTFGISGTKITFKQNLHYKGGGGGGGGLSSNFEMARAQKIHTKSAMLLL